MPVDEYTFTVPRQQPPSHLQQQAFFQVQQQCLPVDIPTAGASGLADNVGNLRMMMGYHHQLNTQLQSSLQDVQGEEEDQTPPTPPPRLASAMNTMQFARASRNMPLDNATWQVSNGVDFKIRVGNEFQFFALFAHWESFASNRGWWCLTQWSDWLTSLYRSAQIVYRALIYDV